jgi:dimeric dUTPase (all-alpha-NTP-PPase superfamily)
LQEIFTKQKALQKIIEKKDPNRHLYKPEPFLGYRIFMIIEAIERECKEVKDETGWKWWKRHKSLSANDGMFSQPKLDYKCIKEECIDIWHFLVQLSLEVGLTPDEIYRLYLDKHKENINRQDNNY